MQRKLCALTIIIVLVILGLYRFGITLFNYAGKKEGIFTATIEAEAVAKNYMNTYTASIDGKKFILYIPKSVETYEIGNIVEFEGKYGEPNGQRNYGGFDYKLYLKTKKIYGTFKVETVKLIQKNEKNIKYKIERIYSKIRKNISNELEKNLKEKNAALVTGLLIGDKSRIDSDTIENFRDASLSHILAISGAHFSYIILVLNFINKRLKRKRIGQLFTITSILFFMKLTGSTASVMRAGIMSILLILGSLLYRRNDFWTNISISILIQVILNPYIIFDIGLILSYGGVIGIVLFYNIIYKKIKLKMISVTISANIVIIPIMMYNFNTISLSFILSNIVASVLLGPIIILGFISVIVQFKPLFFILNFLLNILVKTTELTANLSFSKIYVATPSIISIFSFYSLIGCFLSRHNRKNNYRNDEINNSKNNNTKYKTKNIERIKNANKKNKLILKIVAMLVIILSNLNFELINSYVNKILIINFIDVGQGDSTLIRYLGKNIMIDSGGNTESSYSSSKNSSNKNGYDVGKNILLPYLLDRKILKLDYIIISHFDADHCQGFMYLLENINVKNAVISKQAEDSELYQQFLKISKQRKTNIIYVKNGDNIKIRDIEFKIIHPQSELIVENPLNNNAIVCKLIYNTFSMLFTGDIEKPAEEILLRQKDNKKSINNNENASKKRNTGNTKKTGNASEINNSLKLEEPALKADILKVGHHGSKTSTSQEFLDKVNPQIAIIGVGQNNKFGHPNSETIKKLDDKKIKTYRTDLNGEITINIDKNGRINIKKHIK